MYNKYMEVGIFAKEQGRTRIRERNRPNLAGQRKKYLTLATSGSQVTSAFVEIEVSPGTTSKSRKYTQGESPEKYSLLRATPSSCYQFPTLIFTSRSSYP